MNAKLVGLLSMLGIVVVGVTTITIYTPNSGVTRADLIDAGVAQDCTKRNVRCEFRRADGGYAEVKFSAAWCASASSAIIPPKFAPYTFRADTCTPYATTDTLVADDVEVAVPFDCACSTGANCTVGGAPAIVGNTLAAGTWTGAGCVPKNCGLIAGDPDNWPANCPLQ